MKAPNFVVVSTYANKSDADKSAIEQGLNPLECVFRCENGMFGYEIRIYDDWEQWQPELYIPRDADSEYDGNSHHTHLD